MVFFFFSLVLGVIAERNKKQTKIILLVADTTSATAFI